MVEPALLVQRIRDRFLRKRSPYNSEYEFIIACDPAKMDAKTRGKLLNAGGVTFIDAENTKDNQTEDKIRLAMEKIVRQHAKLNPESLKNLLLILISGGMDADFRYVHDLRNNWDCSIVLIHNIDYNSKSETGWNEIYAYDDLITADLQVREQGVQNNLKNKGQASTISPNTDS